MPYKRKVTLICILCVFSCLVLIVVVGCYISVTLQLIDVEDTCPCALQNDRGLCYVNASVQAFLSSQHFIRLLETYHDSKNMMVQHFRQIKQMMNENRSINLFDTYKTMFKEASDCINIHKSGGYALFVIEYIGWYIENDIHDSPFFSEDNYQQIKAIQRRKTCKGRHLIFFPLLKGNVQEVVRSGLEKNVDKDRFVFPDIFIVCRWHTHSNDTSTDSVICAETISIFGMKYELVSILVSTKNRATGVRHVCAICRRNKKWYEFDNNSVKVVHNKKLIFNNKQCSVAFYDRIV